MTEVASGGKDIIPSYQPCCEIHYYLQQEILYSRKENDQIFLTGANELTYNSDIFKTHSAAIRLQQF